MKRLQKVALLTALAEKLRERGSWCGETHLQKASYFLQELLEVPTQFDFILYKHGPFSFDLRDELTAMRADGFLDVNLMPYPYGPSLIPTRRGWELLEQFPNTVRRYGGKIDFLAETIASKRVADLEKLATALYVTRESHSGATVRDRALRMSQLKPYILIEEGEAAVRTLDAIMAKAETFVV